MQFKPHPAISIHVQPVLSIIAIFNHVQPYQAISSQFQPFPSIQAIYSHLQSCQAIYSLSAIYSHLQPPPPLFKKKNNNNKNNNSLQLIAISSMFEVRSEYKVSFGVSLWLTQGFLVVKKNLNEVGPPTAAAGYMSPSSSKNCVLQLRTPFWSLFWALVRHFLLYHRILIWMSQSPPRVKRPCHSEPLWPT